MARGTRVLLLAILTILTIWLLLTARNFVPSPQHQALAPANATLGFGTILAVSRPHSRRRPGLLWAANLTDVEIVIPSQPVWSDADLDALLHESESAISKGSARAWLGHLNALRSFLETDKVTALIIEDDVDFDISIRSHQIPLLASSIRALLRNASAVHTAPYWGDDKDWDLLYPGHCDDALPTEANPLLSHAHLMYTDTTVPFHSLLHPDTSNFLASMRIPESTRLVHRSFAPFCTFAYAVTRRAAERFVSEYTTAKHGADAFDVQLLMACRNGLQCFSVAPELFHHIDGASVIASVNTGVDEGVSEFGGYEMARLGKGSWNVRCGARHRQLWIDEKDGSAREEAKSMVRGMLGRGEAECPIDLVRAERSWKGCEWGECGAQS
ncbi:hypothetical protein C7974DRAFT_305869 [Boeremia exigua]|uniref:uncharacterized protein n=1 Tax=Boeremia exigua TaxID=749465 RepID=UPI001E8CADF8|nr:uncharacterized protein C7974DRAFT_305869 [Boeremia exigua]KAH6638960.1 hypothetical protein C7974DRAFT_305869 [Boeremia exigua]